jgi:hypothetical protein
VSSAPDDHLSAGPHCRVIVPGRWRIDRARGCPTVCAGAVSPAGVHQGAAADSAPDDHFAARPYRSVSVSGIGRVDGAGGCPTVGGGIISPAGVNIPAAA